jgi:hypothetical protein
MHARVPPVGLVAKGFVGLLAVRRISASVSGLERRWVRQIQRISASPDAVKLRRYTVDPPKTRFIGSHQLMMRTLGRMCGSRKTDGKSRPEEEEPSEGLLIRTVSGMQSAADRFESERNFLTSQRDRRRVRKPIIGPVRGWVLRSIASAGDADAQGRGFIKRRR